ncbi:MAG: ABC transporter substrate-binding protein [Spirulina sp.]
MKFLRREKLIGLVLGGLLLTNCAGPIAESTTKTSENTSPQDETLTIWWNRSYYLQEDEALEKVIAAWQSKTGKKVNFSFVSQDDILKDTQNALKAGNPPDIVFASRADDTLGPRWAWDGELADVSEVVEPLKELYSQTALKSVYLYNSKTQKRSAYAVPLKQQSVHIHYWQELLAEAGLKAEEIPTEWDAFWDFWKQAQDNLRRKGREDIYAIGLPMSAEASDTHAAFEHVLDAYDVQLLDEEGNLLLDAPQLRQRVATALNWYASFYKEGYIPPEAENWTNSSNNSAFLNQKVLMVVNPTLSIPGSQREDEEVYTQQIATIGFPKEPDGEHLKSIVTVKQVLLFESSPNQETAKDFLSFLVQPENLGPYLEGSLGRYFPVMPKLTSEPFWNDPADPHIFVANQQFQSETRSNYQSLNPAYAAVQSESVWGRAIERVIIEGASPEEAADEALKRIEAIFAQWDR